MVQVRLQKKIRKELKKGIEGGKQFVENPSLLAPSQTLKKILGVLPL